ncbi:MAG: hypothetical protein NC041_10490 [Bacteroides sp.]|nr:hypothetical protein [Prevotella sp.]MCM1407828.1 hypothetical protein [Treponema brennaborense]MCM1470881.1 hypothetical protein [Bacteroides sp.]
MAHATVRATILPEIIKLICSNYNVSEQQALDMFYSSKTGESFADDDTGLYGQSPLYIYGLFKEETK